MPYQLQPACYRVFLKKISPPKPPLQQLKYFNGPFPASFCLFLYFFNQTIFGTGIRTYNQQNTSLLPWPLDLEVATCVTSHLLWGPKQVLPSYWNALTFHSLNWYPVNGKLKPRQLIHMIKVFTTYILSAPNYVKLSQIFIFLDRCISEKTQ